MANDALLELVRLAGRAVREPAPVGEWADPDAPDAVCDHCGNRRHCCHLPDPVLVDVVQDSWDINSWWCRPCYAARLAEV